MAERKALVAGATGIVGRALIAHLAALSGWQVAGAARKPHDLGAGVDAVAVDLADREACFAALARVPGVTHLFYAARAPRADAGEEARLNAAMLVNLVDALEASSPGLAHVQLVHGTKWYGSHLGPFKTPAKEDDPRGPGPNFYFDQQDFVAVRASARGWTWSALRPHFVSGVCVGHPHNIMGVVAVTGALCRELGIPLVFPGGAGRYATLTQLTDAGLLAEAMLWAATTPACANRAFNIGNGDNIRWCHTWPKVAALFGLEPGPPGAVDIARFLTDHAGLWQEMAARHGLAAHRLDELASPDYAAFAFGATWDEMSSTVKARRAGFHAAIDSEDMIADVIGAYRRLGLIPG